MSRTFSLRRVLSEAAGFTVVAWRRAPLWCALLAAALLVPVAVGERAVSIWAAIPLALALGSALVFGWTGLVRAALAAEAPQAGFGAVEARMLGSILLNALFLSLIVMVLGIVLLGVAGATGLAEGDDLTMMTTAVVAENSWRTFVLLTLEIAAVLLFLTLAARLSPSAAETVAGRRVASLGVLGWTRGTGLKPAAGLVVTLIPLVGLVLTGLLWPVEAAWIDWAWAGVLAFIQAPLLAGYATALWRAVRPQGDPA